MNNQILSDNEVRDLISKKIQTCKLLNYNIRPISESVTGYLSEHLRIKCEIETEKGKELIQFFIKRKLMDVPMREFGDDINAFQNEIIILTFINREAPEATWAPKIIQHSSNMIIFDDLSVTNFELIRQQFLDVQHAKCVLRVLIQLQIFSFKYEKLQQLFNPNYSILDDFRIFTDTMNNKNTEMGKKWIKSTENCLNFLISETTISQKYSKPLIINRLREFLDEFCNGMQPKRGKYHVISHGDLWTNNIMFKYQQSKPIDCCLVDFQVMRFVPFVQDPLLALYINTLKEFRDQNLATLLDYYYETLSDELLKNGLDLIPRGDYDALCKKRMKYVLVLSLIYKCFFIMGTEKINEIMGSKEGSSDMILGDKVQFLKPLLNDPKYALTMFTELQELIDELMEN